MTDVWEHLIPPLAIYGAVCVVLVVYLLIRGSTRRERLLALAWPAVMLRWYLDSHRRS